MASASISKAFQNELGNLMRVFLGLAEVSGFYSNLKAGFDEIGVPAELVTLTQHRFGYSDNHPSIWVRLAQGAVAGRLTYHQALLPIRLFWALWAAITRLMLLIWALLRFDVFVFGCSTSFFRFRELPLLKLLGKKVIYNFHGTDGRCGFMDGFAEDMFLAPEFREGTGYIGPLRESDDVRTKRAKITAYAEITALRKANVDRIDRYADAVINSPSHGQHHTRPFVQRLIIGMPYMPNCELIARQQSKPSGSSVKILHSPSYPEGKGSPQIREAIQALKIKGLDIEFIEVTGRPNSEVLELIGQCDFVIDQLYSDMAMVGFATEAAFFGKPAIVGGYYAAHQQDDLVEEWIPPTYFCAPEKIEEAIEKLVVDEEFRQDLGAKARAFVETRWLAPRSAERIIALANGDFPKEWLFDPTQSSYVGGMGLPSQSVSDIANGIIEQHGIGALFLNDKPIMQAGIAQMGESEADKEPRG